MRSGKGRGEGDEEGGREGGREMCFNDCVTGGRGPRGEDAGRKRGIVFKDRFVNKNRA